MKKILSMAAVAALFAFALISLSSCNKRKVRVVEHEGIRFEEFQEIEAEDGSFLKDGYYKEWYENGQIRRNGYFANNKEDGHWKCYFTDGTLLEEGDYDKGNKVGHWVTYTNKGEVGSEGDYVNDKRDGDWMIRLYDGTVKNYQYKDGIIVTILGKWLDNDGSVWNFNEDGTYTQTRKDGKVEDGTFKYEIEGRCEMDHHDGCFIKFSEDNNELTIGRNGWSIFYTHYYIKDAKRIIE